MYIELHGYDNCIDGVSSVKNTFSHIQDDYFFKQK